MSSEKNEKRLIKFVKKMRKKNKMNEMSIKKRDINFFEFNNNKHKTFNKLKIVFVFTRRWQKTSRIKDWDCTKSWLNQRMFSSCICVLNVLSSQIICFFDACQLCYRLIAFVIILDKRLNTSCFSVSTKQRINKTCLKMMIWRIFANY